MKKTEILVIMVDSRGLDNINNFNKAIYNELSCLINYSFCLKYNYSFKYYKIEGIKKNLFHHKSGISAYCYESLETRSNPWCKLLAVYKELSSSYDYIVYIDSDCVFLNHKISLNNYINKLDMSNKLIMMFCDKPWNDDLPTAGFIIFKNHKATAGLVKKWWRKPSRKYAHIHSYEQETLHSFYRKGGDEEIVSNVLIYDEWQFEVKKKDQLIIHLSSEKNELRNPIFTFLLTYNKIADDINLHDAIDKGSFFHNLNCASLSLEIYGKKHRLLDTINIYVTLYLYIPIKIYIWEEIKYFIKLFTYYLYPINHEIKLNSIFFNKIFKRLLIWKTYIKFLKSKKVDLEKNIEIYKRLIS